MEFEKAVFRVYERSMEGVLSEEESQQSPDQQPQLYILRIFKKPCMLFQHCMLFFTIFFFITLLVLHHSFVGSAGCLPRELMVLNTTTGKSSVRTFQSDEILYIRLSKSLLEHSGSNLRSLTDDDSVFPNAADGSSSSIVIPSMKSIRPNSRAFLSMIGVDRGQIDRSLQHMVAAYNNPTNWSPLPTSSDKLVYSSQKSTVRRRTQGEEQTQIPSFSPTFTPTFTPTMVSNVSSEFVPFDYDYQITFDGGVTVLDSLMRHEHQFQTYNITLGESRECFGSRFAVSLLPFGGLDIAILNNIMYTIDRSGYMLTRNGELFRWHHSDILSRSVGEWIVWKITMVVNTVLSFFFLTTTTSLLVRVLISSGVILIFPIFWILQVLFGLEPINLRIVSISYPWIGLPLQLIRSRNQSLTPFIIGHMSKVVLYYLMYIGAQSLYLKLFYDSSVTFGLDQVWLFAVMMLWEYYTMIYVRASGSIVLFSRGSLALFFMYHLYYYSFPSGFHSLALTLMTFALMSLMIFCVRTFELKAFRQGLVNIEQPRMLYVSLPWPSWRADLAPEYTLFMPLNSRSSSVYQNQVPARPNSDPSINPTVPGADIEMTNTTPNDSNTQQIPPGATSTNGSSTPLSFITRFLNPTNYQSTATREQVDRGSYSSVNTDSTHG